jgi:predicted PurR-regulated permease PerM
MVKTYIVTGMNNRRTLQTIFIFALFALMFFLTIYMMIPFFTVILWTVLLYILAAPVYKRCVSKLDTKKRFYGFKHHVLAGLFSIGILLLIIIPLAVIAVLLIHQLAAFLHTAETFINQNSDFFSASKAGQAISGFVDKLSMNYIHLDTMSIQDNLLKFLHHYSARIITAGTILIKSAGKFLISILFVAFALFFVFLDGHYLASLFIKAIPIKPQYMSKLIKKFTEITRQLFAGYILVALYQGTAAFIIMTAFQVKGALLFSVVLMFASFIPLFGAALVWLPVGLIIFFTGAPLKGIIFMALSAVFVSLVDNFLRPLFLKDRIQVHPLVIFFAILGGLKVFGMNGLILGPMIMILFFTVLDLLVSQDDTALPDK